MIPRGTRRARLAGLLAGAALTALGLPAATAAGATPPAAAAVPSPTITVPPAGSHGFPFLSEASTLPAQGYSEQEYFLSGTATSYDKAGTWTADGHWGVTPGTTAPYTTRILVRRPTDPAKFSGVVDVEWLNDTGQIDAPVDWLDERSQLESSGDAWVGVSAQQVGVDDSLGALVGLPGLKQWDPDRYGALNHPGDQYSYDIFSQAAEALRHPDGPNPLGTLHPTTILATGDSQSALRLTTYVNAVAPLAHVFDGYLIHSNASSAAPIGQGIIELGGLVPRIRTDLTVPTFVLETETDVALNSSARQPDTPTVHTWEIAGTAHADAYLLNSGGSALGGSLGLGSIDTSTLCGTGDAPINDGPGHEAADAALAALSRWAAGGQAPASAQPLTTANNALVRDAATGLAEGGVRLPDVTVPTRTISGQRGLNDLTSAACSLFGSSDPWNGSADAWDRHDSGDPSDYAAAGVPEPSLAALYPTHADYVAKVTAAADAAEAGGFLTPGDAAAIVAAAGTSPVGG